MGTPKPRLIDDLVPLVLESNDHWWTCDLLRLATVSPAWLWPVRKRLYTHPRLRSFAACRLFARSLKENEELRTLIRGIDLYLSNPSCHGGADKESLWFILSLDELRRLTLGGELAVRAERFLNALAHPNAIAELSVDGNPELCSSWDQRTASLEWDEGVAFRFPNLRRLKLSNLALDVIYSSIPYELEVSELVLDNVHIIGGHAYFLLNQCWSHLRHLFVIVRSASEFDETLRPVLDSCGPTLETLHYEIRRDPRTATRIFDSESQPCPRLRRLHLSDVAVDHGTLLAIAECCPNLDELYVLGRTASLSASDWALLVRSGAFPRLERLCTPGGTHGPPFERWDTAMSTKVVEECSLRGVICISK